MLLKMVSNTARHLQRFYAEVELGFLLLAAKASSRLNSCIFFHFFLLLLQCFAQMSNEKTLSIFSAM
jgi:hypothetical protein